MTDIVTNPCYTAAPPARAGEDSLNHRDTYSAHWCGYRFEW
jgi:hypothetical protein